MLVSLIVVSTVGALPGIPRAVISSLVTAVVLETCPRSFTVILYKPSESEASALRVG
nr:MAG TPA: hypothetical protein [Caudoviricetes sp.]